ncbi:MULTISPECIES: hypothetical protein [unclassified Streptomyces]|uniref:hypothetical protein n=1 Tax=unclassified Streptomyces TaxID=2593676 RepID=UPI00381A3F13
MHGAVLTSALLLCDDEKERAELVRLVVLGLDRFVEVLPDDGGVDEAQRPRPRPRHRAAARRGPPRP